MPMHLSVTRMNVAFRMTGLALVAIGMQAIGMQLIPLGQLFSSSVPHVLVSEAGQIQLPNQGDDPDMGDREGVPPSAGSGSR
jgi:hypothetical protein